jgi:hypothetical protein
MIGRVMECITWGLAGVSFAALLILSFGLTYEQVQAILTHWEPKWLKTTLLKGTVNTKQQDALGT